MLVTPLWTQNCNLFNYNNKICKHTWRLKNEYPKAKDIAAFTADILHPESLSYMLELTDKRDINQRQRRFNI